MKIVIASDHTGIDHRRAVREELERLGHQCLDIGTSGEDPQDDYPDYAIEAARRVAAGQADAAVCICGTGIGMSIAANKIAGIRAAVCWDEFSTRVSRTHNNANVLCLGARVLDPATAARLAAQWTRLPFEGGRHARRLAKITKLEKTN
jgi:ribose 5-phosphate isomerase B